MNEKSILTNIETCADLLAQHSSIHFISLGLTISTTIMALAFRNLHENISFYWLLQIFTIVILGLIETAAAVRTGFDHRLLQRLSRNNALPATHWTRWIMRFSNLSLYHLTKLDGVWTSV